MSKAAGFIFAGVAAIVLIFLAVWLIDIDVEDEGEMPELDVDVSGDAGELPEMDADVAEIEVRSKEVDVEVPDVDVEMEEETVEVPTIEKVEDDDPDDNEVR